MFRFCFMDPVNGFIELDLVKTFQDGWTIDPTRKPLRVSVYFTLLIILILSLLLFVLHTFLQIKKRDADLFGTAELPIPPTCRVTLWSKVSQDTEEYLSYTVPLIGIHSDDVDEICIQRFLETSNTSGIYNIYNII